jgi:hypothetical protein
MLALPKTPAKPRLGKQPGPGRPDRTGSVKAGEVGQAAGEAPDHAASGYEKPHPPKDRERGHLTESV